jgi:hypothetical protein
MRKIMIAAALALGAASMPAAAQIQAGNLVNVNVSQILIQDILSDNNVDVDVTAPITVQLPISVAANVCDVAVNVLARQAAGHKTATCDAKSKSDALSQQVVRAFSAQSQ